ncbi:electron transport complex subunit RsxC [Suttonella ornithocola]|uniref:Ion-translocating oxidoreductase complex subunit C n=1 Tax=Suttonella ornithocola TaxID=279832 RepID=A0A380MLB8_9GAMM|nr:electron transport complex subunit RsxC [Suttonella ornithocola]SUO93439.1 Nitrogen fixation protein rnfC [Suttonella ornithocola]
MRLLDFLFGARAKPKRFHGGLHIPAHKAKSTQTPATFHPLSAEYHLSLRQRDNNWLEPVVEEGQRVLGGEVLARPSTSAGLMLHAPTSGIIKAITPIADIHRSSEAALSIILESDGKDCHIAPLPPLNETSPIDALLKRIEQCGIAGLGGAGFPTARKLSGFSRGKKNHDTPIEPTLVVNAAECEPYITCDDSQIREHAADILRGAQLAAHIIGASHIRIGIENDKPQAIVALETAIAQTNDTRIQLSVVPAKYPSGNSRQLIELLFNLRIPSNHHASDYDLIVHNSATLKAVHDAIILGKPLIERYTTITGENLSHPHNRIVRLGTPLQELLEAAGGMPENSHLLIGGPMMGEPQTALSAGINKTTNCLLVLPNPREAESLDCIRCARCSEACPMSLMPQQLHWYSRNQNIEQLQHYRLFDCIECGICASVCPSSIPLVEQYRQSKTHIKNQQREQIAAERAKARHEAREARLKREAEERQAKMEAKRAALQKRAAQQNVTPSEHDKTAAIETAKARAAARKQAQSANQNQSPNNFDPTTGSREPLSKHSATETTSAKDKSAAIEAAKARAATRRAARQAEKNNPLNNENTASADEREAKLAAARAKAEARKQARQSQTNDNPPNNGNTASADEREAKLAAARAKAEARRKARQNATPPNQE